MKNLKNLNHDLKNIEQRDKHLLEKINNTNSEDSIELTAKREK